MADIIINDADSILYRALESLSNSTQLTRTSAGSKVRSIMQIISAEIEAAQTIMQANVALSMINGASGPYLDLLGEILGVARQQPKSARLALEDGGVTISAPAGLTFGNLNAGMDIVLPAGTLFSDDAQTAHFRSTEDILLDSAASSINISAIAIESGPESNLASGQITTVHYTGYSAYPESKLTANNLSSLESGQNEESDSLYRYRLQSALLGAEKANETAIRLGLLSLPGVRDVITMDLARGIGTADFLIETDSTEIGVKLWEQAELRIETIKAAGIDVKIREPKNVGLDIEVTISTTRLQGQSAVATAIQNKVADIVRSTSLGGALSLNKLSALITTAHSSIASIGSPGKPIDSISIWRTSEYSNRRVPFAVRDGSDIALAPEERLVLEGSPAEAVRVTIRE